MAAYDSKIRYLGFTGEQYIELPIVPDENTDCIELIFERSEDTAQQRFWISTPYGTDTSNVFQSYVNGSKAIGYNNNNVWTYVNNNYTVLGLTKHTLRFDYANKKVYLDENEFTISITPRTGEYNILIFGKFSTNATFKGNLYSIRYWRNNTIIHNSIPVRVNDVGYMYDKVSDTLFGNAGSGSFVLGTDKPKPTSDYTKADFISFRGRMFDSLIPKYVSNGLLAWYDGIWNNGFLSHNGNFFSWVDLSGNEREMTLSKPSWSSNSFVVLQSEQNTAYPSSAFRYVTCEIVFKVDWVYNTSYYEACVLGGFTGLGLYVQSANSNVVKFYFSDNTSGGGYSNKRFGFDSPPMGDGCLGKMLSVQYIVGGNTSDNLSAWKAFLNGVEQTMWYTSAGINPGGIGINCRSDRRFAGNVYALRMYDRVLTNDELKHNLLVDNKRFNLGLTI